MSVFIVIIPLAVLIDSPPESNVMPLPTSATSECCRRRRLGIGVRRLVGEVDEPRRLDRASSDPEQPTEARGDDRLLVEDRRLEPGALGHLDGDLGELGRGERTGRLVGEVPRQASRVRR